MSQELTLERLKFWLTYNPDTGIFTHNRGRNRTGKQVGTRDRCGTIFYMRCQIDNRRYTLHRLAWFYMTGAWPPKYIDHKDGDGCNNRWGNLRAATASQNQYNKKIGKNNTSGYKGVTFSKALQKYRACIKFGQISKSHIFNTAEEAHRAYVQAAERHFGDFARAA